MTRAEQARDKTGPDTTAQLGDLATAGFDGHPQPERAQERSKATGGA